MVDNTVNSNSEFYYSNVSPISTNFNVNPYWDDFDDTKNYYKILFKPGYPVQSRELTQIQSILQDQIQKFGQHMFEEGSQVLGGKYYIDTRAHFVKVNDTDTLGNTVDISMFKDQLVTGQTTGIQAYVNYTVDGTQSSNTPKTLYVTYVSSNPDTDEFAFAANEPLVSNVGTLVVGNTTPVGYGSVFTINEGVRFCKQHFIHHDKQTVVIDRYGTSPSCKVGFVLVEEIVDASEDSSLLDPAQESSNFAAPGADRFKITPILTRLDINDPAGYPDYVNLFIIENGRVIEKTERPIYNIIRDEMAKRTMDESGDYYVKGFNVVLEEHLDLGNGGYLTALRGGNFNLLSVQVEPGTAYVKGYEINKLVTNYLTTDKATTYANVNSQILTSTLGGYIVVKEAVGSWNVNSGQTIDLYDTAQQRVSLGKGSTTGQTGTKIGTARIKSISYDNGLIGTANGTMRVHLFDLNMLGSNSFSNVKSVYYNSNTSADIGADIVLNTLGKAAIKDTFSTPLFYTGSNHTKTIRSQNGDVDTTYLFKKTSDVSIASDGTFTLSTVIGNESFPYGTTTLSDTDKKDIFLTLNDPITISLPGTATSGNSTTVLGGSGTQFTRLNVGDKISLSGNSTIYNITAIDSSLSANVSPQLPPVVSGNTISKVYLAGDMIDMRSIGCDAGAVRTVSTTSTGMSFDLKETLGSTISGTITYTMARTSAREIAKKLKTSRYVIIDCATAGTTGPFDLGFSDIYRIRSIRKDTSAFTAADQGTDVTLNFGIDSGQRDDYYGHGRITPIGLTLTASDKLLVCLDYFEPDYTLGVGYFSIDSYPINDQNPLENEITTLGIPTYTSSISGATFNLRNVLDFRPVYTNTAADSTTIAGATTNPVAATTLQFESAGLRIPADSEPITFDYSYYLARRDVVAIDSAGTIQIVKGVPAAVPVTPACPMHLMSLAKLYISPYPSLSPTYANQINRSQLSCTVTRTSQVRFTMKDIGVLKQRIDNIENYVSLSLLEKSAMDMKILDENGLDRFKNGIFVDSFTSFSLSDMGNPDHHICYDPKEGSIRPIFDTQAIGYDLYSSSNLVKVSNLLMLPYTEVIAARQPYATTIRNVETTVFRFVGNLYLDPDSDYWVNTKRLASQTIYFGSTDTDVTPYSIVYGSWQTTVTGVTTTDPILISTTTGQSTTSSSSSVGGSVGDLTGTWVGPHAVYEALPSLISAYGGDFVINLSSGTSTMAAANYSANITLAQLQEYLELEKNYWSRIPAGLSQPTTVLKNNMIYYIFQDGTEIEAWGGAGINYLKSLGFGVHGIGGTVFDLFGNDGIFEVRDALWAPNSLTNNLTRYNPPGISSQTVNVPLTLTITGSGGTASISIIETTTTTTTNTYQTTSTTSSQATRTFTETFQTLQTQSQSLGDKVVAVAPIADIRPQIIAFEGRGLKAKTRHYVYFDGQLMSFYVSPGTMTSIPSTLAANTNASLITRTGPEGYPLYSNDKGYIYGFLRIPADESKTFRTGSKQFIVTDSPTNETDATSAALTYFNAQGITQTVQDTIVTTGTIVTETKTGIEKSPVVYSTSTNTYTTVVSTTTSTSNTIPGTPAGDVRGQAILTAVSCMAYSFKLNTPQGEEGTFLSSVDVFFQGKDPAKGIWFEIRAMDNAGTITKVQVPGSEVWLTTSQVNVSEDGSVATNVKFKAPVFLLNDQEYAFVIHTEGINPNYYMFVSVLGQRDILTQQFVNERPLTGTLFTTNNNTDWDIVPRVDLKITFNRAKFTTGVVGQAIIGNQHRDYIKLPLDLPTLANVSWFGEGIRGTDELTLTTPTGGSIVANGYLIGSTSGANARVQSINGSKYKLSGTGFVVGETVTANTGASASIVSISGANGSIYSVQVKSNTNQFNGNSAVVVIKDSNGLFAANDTLRGTFTSRTTQIKDVSKFIYSTVQFEPSYLNFKSTITDFNMSMRSNTGTLTDYNGIAIGVPVDFNTEMAIYSRTTELASYGGSPSNLVKVEMSTPTDYLSPVVNLDRTYTVYIQNLINSNTAGELLPFGGGLKNKYISQVITLADGQDAEDLRVILTGYRPPSSNSDIKVYARLAHAEDFESIYARNWIQLEPFNNSIYSSLNNRKDWREFQYKFPASSMVGVNDQDIPIVGYTNSANTTFTGFRQYQIKIGLQSDTSAIYPRVADLRCIALQL